MLEEGYDYNFGYEDTYNDAEQALEDFVDGRTIIESDLYWMDGQYYWECTVEAC